MPSVAFVTGATGFIAQHLVNVLLSHNYKVIGSVRTEQKGEYLKRLFGDNFHYEVISSFVEPSAFDEALKKHPDVELFFHTASPVHFGDDDIENNLLKPALEGTVNALKSVHTHAENVIKFVYTSSYITFIDLKDRTKRVTEESWNPITHEEALMNGAVGYAASKTFAEKAAWKFVEENRPQFKFITLHPAFVFGPQLFASEVKGKDLLNLSSDLITQYLRLLPFDDLPDFRGAYIDVRDVAEAHFVAGESSEVDGNRLALSNGPFASQTILDIIRNNFPELQVTLPTGDPAKEEQELRSATNDDFSKSEELLKLDYIGLEKSIVDCVSQVL